MSVWSTVATRDKPLISSFKNSVSRAVSMFGEVFKCATNREYFAKYKLIHRSV